MDLGLLYCKIFFISFIPGKCLFQMFTFSRIPFHHTDKMGLDSLGDLFCLRQCNKWFLFHNLISFPCGGSLLYAWYFFMHYLCIYISSFLILQDNLRKRKEACKGVPFPLRIIVLPDRLLCLVLFLMNVLKIAKQSGSIQLVHTYHTHDIGSCCCLMASCIGKRYLR